MWPTVLYSLFPQYLIKRTILGENVTEYQMCFLISSAILSRTFPTVRRIQRDKAKNILIYIEQDATLHSLFHLETALRVSGGTSTHHQERKTTVSTASGICHTFTAICRYRGRVGTAEQFQLFHDSGR